MPNVPTSLLQLCEQFLEAHYPDCICAGLTGSRATGAHAEHSDIDLLVLVKDLAHEQVKTHSFETNSIDVILLPYERFEPILWKDIKSRAGIYLGMLNNFIILKDKTGYLQKASDFAKQTYAAGARAGSLQEYIYLQRKLLNVANALNTPSFTTNDYLLISYGVSYILAYYKLSNNAWESKEKLKESLIKAASPEQYSGLMNALTDCYKREDKNAFIAFMHMLADEIKAKTDNWPESPE